MESDPETPLLKCHSSPFMVGYDEFSVEVCCCDIFSLGRFEGACNLDCTILLGCWIRVIRGRIYFINSQVILLALREKSAKSQHIEDQLRHTQKNYANVALEIGTISNSSSYVGCANYIVRSQQPKSNLLQKKNIWITS